MRHLLLFLLLTALLAACGGDDAARDGQALEGPALVMWYTDN